MSASERRDRAVGLGHLADLLVERHLLEERLDVAGRGGRRDGAEGEVGEAEGEDGVPPPQARKDARRTRASVRRRATIRA